MSSTAQHGGLELDFHVPTLQLRQLCDSICLCFILICCYWYVFVFIQNYNYTSFSTCCIEKCYASPIYMLRFFYSGAWPTTVLILNMWLPAVVTKHVQVTHRWVMPSRDTAAAAASSTEYWPVWEPELAAGRVILCWHCHSVLSYISQFCPGLILCIMEEILRRVLKAFEKRHINNSINCILCNRISNVFKLPLLVFCSWWYVISGYSNM